MTKKIKSKEHQDEESIKWESAESPNEDLPKPDITKIVKKVDNDVKRGIAFEKSVDMGFMQHQFMVRIPNELTTLLSLKKENYPIFIFSIDAQQIMKGDEIIEGKFQIKPINKKPLRPKPKRRKNANPSA